MKARLLKLREKVDAMSVRERALLFGAVAAVLAFVFYSALLDPLFIRQKSLRSTISQQQNNVQGIDDEITATVQAYAIDPDLPNKTRLAALKAASERLSENLRAVQTGLVPPERIAPLLGSILEANGKLRLVSLKSLPVSSLTGPLEDASKTPAAAPAPAPASDARSIYRHGVEVSVRGNYLDMINYMDALEAMPTQLFWGKAHLEVEEYPTARLTLTLYTLSLDKKWMKL